MAELIETTEQEHSLADVGQFETGIIMKPGVVQIVGFEETLHKAETIRDALLTVTVTEDSIQVNKRMLARLNKAFREIDDQRKAYKREYIKPFSVVEEQCKSLKAVIDEADSYIRSQIREFEEIEREKKNEQIKKLWDKRTQRQKYRKFMEFEDFMNASYLNKTYSMNKVESEMAAYISSRTQDIEDLKVFCEVNDYAFSDALICYRKKGTLAATMLELDLNKAQKEIIEMQLEEQNSFYEYSDPYVCIYVRESDLEKLFELASENSIQLYEDAV